MIKEQLINKLQTWAPDDTAEAWDNVGLQVDTTRDIKRVALVLEINLDTWDIIQKYDYDLIYVIQCFLDNQQVLFSCEYNRGLE